MAVPVPHTWTAGDNATSTVMQTLTDTGLWNLGSATSTGVKKDFAVLRQTVAQSIPNGTTAWTAVTFDTEDADYANGHSTTTNPTRYTGKNPGWYAVTAVFAISNNATGRRLVGVAKNGSTTPTDARHDSVAAANVAVFTVTGKVYMNGTTDYIEVVVFQDSGGALNTAVSSTDTQCRLEVEWRSN